MEITETTTEYKVDQFRVQIEKDFKRNRHQIYVFNKDTEIVFNSDDVTEAKALCSAILQVIETLKIETPYGDKTAAELEKKEGDEKPL